MRFRLVPTDDRFFELFNDSAANVAECARRLRSSLDDGGGRFEMVKECERRGDEITQELLQRLNTTFVTPFDREDIHALAEELDDVVDDMLEVTHRLELSSVGTMILPELKQQADLLVQMAECTVELLQRLPSMKGVQPYLDSIDTLESEGDTVYRHAVARLFSGEFEALDVLRWKDIIEPMETGLNTLEDISNVVESIVLKHA